MQNIAIIIPCYNEAKRLNTDLVKELLDKNEAAAVIFVDDGSTDGTADLLQQIKDLYPGRIELIPLERNMGKAAAVYAGTWFAIEKKQYAYAGYLDADFSTPPAQFELLYKKIAGTGADFIFGSRLKSFNLNISRSYFRHFFGRIIATIIDTRFKLGIYDTQCGAKIFSIKAAEAAFAKPFKTKWLFDVEVFLRLREKGLFSQGMEMPLEEWKDVKGSKLTFFHFPLIAAEIIKLFRGYRRPEKNLA